MPVAINNNTSYGNSPIDAITKALAVAHTIYGIKQAAAQQDLLNAQLAEQSQKTGQEKTTFDQAQAAAKEQVDPESQTASGLRQGYQTALNGIISNSEIGKKNQSAIHDFVTALNKTDESGKHTMNANQMAASYAPLKDIVDKFGPKDEGMKAIALAMSNRNQRTDEKTDINANEKYGKNLAPYENTIQAASRAQGIIGDIKAGKLMTTPTLVTDLNGAVGSMFNSGKGATVYSMSHADQDSAYKRVQSALGFLESSPRNTLPAAQLDQLDKDIGSLKNAYLDAHDVAYNSFREGLPDRVREKLDNRFNKFRSNFTGATKQDGGGGIPGMGSAQAADIDPKIADWAKQHGQDYGTASQILKARGYGK